MNSKQKTVEQAKKQAIIDSKILTAEQARKQAKQNRTFETFTETELTVKPLEIVLTFDNWMAEMLEKQAKAKSNGETFNFEKSDFEKLVSKNQNITETETEQIIHLSKKESFCTVRKLDSVSGTEITRKLMQGFKHLSELKTISEKIDILDDIDRIELTAEQRKTYDNKKADCFLYDDIAGNTEDVISVSTLANIQTIRNDDIDNIFSNGCKDVRNHIYSQGSRGAAKKIVTDDNGNKKEIVTARYHHLYISDIEQEIEKIDAGIDVTKQIEQAETTVLQNTMLYNIFTALTNRQKTVLKQIAKGYSLITVAKHLNCSKQNITNIVNDIRKTAKKLYPNAIINFEMMTEHNEQYLKQCDIDYKLNNLVSVPKQAKKNSVKIYNEQQRKQAEQAITEQAIAKQAEQAKQAKQAETILYNDYFLSPVKTINIPKNYISYNQRKQA